jgi:hypothetical protein
MNTEEISSRYVRVAYEISCFENYKNATVSSSKEEPCFKCMAAAYGLAYSTTAQG